MQVCWRFPFSASKSRQERNVLTLNRRTFLTVSAAATTAIATPKILQARPKELIFGASLPLTGPYAAIGKRIAPAFKLAQTIFNDEGGIAGTPVKFNVADSHYLPQNTLSHYQRALARDGNALVGYFADSTSAMKLIAPELTGKNARIMGSTSFAADHANPKHNPYQYVAGPTYQDQFDLLLERIKAKGGTKVAFVHSITGFGRDPIKHGRAKAAEFGIDVVLIEATKPRSADISAHVKNLALSAADHCILHGYTNEVWPELIASAASQGLPIQFYGTFWGLENADVEHLTFQEQKLLNGYQGVMPYRSFSERKEAPRFQRYAALCKVMFKGSPLENHMPIPMIQTMCSLEIAIKALRDTAASGKEINGRNVAQSLAEITNWDSGGFFAGPVSLTSNKIGTARIVENQQHAGGFAPVSDWLTL